MADAAAHLRRSGASAADCFQDENAGPADSFAAMTAAFSQRISELQQLVCFRVEGASTPAAAAAGGSSGARPC